MRDCSIRLVRAYVRAYMYLYSIKYPRAYFGFVSKSRVNRTVVLKRKSWSFAVKSAKTRNRDNPISHKWCGRRATCDGVVVIRTSEHVLCCFLRIFVLFYFIFFFSFGFDGFRAVAAASGIRDGPRDIAYGSRTVMLCFLAVRRQYIST